MDRLAAVSLLRRLKSAYNKNTTNENTSRVRVKVFGPQEASQIISNVLHIFHNAAHRQPQPTQCEIRYLNMHFNSFIIFLVGIKPSYLVFLLFYLTFLLLAG